jgi:Mg/Co/Ni transporter MgtE
MATSSRRRAAGDALARAGAVLEQIETDEAADIIAKLPDDLAQELLALLPEEREDDLRELVRHPEHTAGSLISTEFVTLPLVMTAGAALEWIRGERPAEHAMSYLYLLDESERLAGVASLRDLVLAQPEANLREIMEDQVAVVTADTDEEEVGRIMTKYDLLAIPVVDEAHHMIGIVTLDDALDAVLPQDWTRRLPRLFR